MAKALEGLASTAADVKATCLNTKPLEALSSEAPNPTTQQHKTPNPGEGTAQDPDQAPFQLLHLTSVLDLDVLRGV